MRTFIGYVKTSGFNGPNGPMNRVPLMLFSASLRVVEHAIKKGYPMFVRPIIVTLAVLAVAPLASAQMYPGTPYDGGYGAEYYGDAGMPAGASACGCGACGGGGGGAMCPPGGYGVTANSFGGLIQNSAAGLRGMAQRPVQNFMGSPAGAAQANALFGWARPGDCAGCGINGYHPDAAAHPQMFGAGEMAAQPGGFPGMEGGYQDLGGTCCGPHWFDFMIESVFLQRTGDTGIGLMSQGIRGFGAPNIVLGSDDIDFTLATGFRATAHWQLNAVNFIEGVYLGGLDWDDRATITSTGNALFSAFSDFGDVPFGGFEDSDQASSSTLFYESELDSVEVNWRRGWVSPDNKFSGTWLVGGRYIRLQETLQHDIRVSPHFDPINMINRTDAFTLYDLDIENDMAGIQVGTELVRCLSPGLLVGVEGKAMAFVNRISQEGQLQSTTLQPPRIENDDDTEFTWGSQAKIFGLWQFHPWMKLRVGYEAMYIDDVATAFGSYDSTPPFINPFVSEVRTTDVRSDENLFFHGFTAGFELGW